MHPITQHAPLHGARLKKCAACGQVKPLTAYTARGQARRADAGLTQYGGKRMPGGTSELNVPVHSRTQRVPHPYKSQA